MQEKSNIKKTSKSETVKEICLYALGIALLAVWFVLASQSKEGVWMEVLSIMGWVAVWEATSIVIMKRPELRLLQKAYDAASKSDIFFSVNEDK